MHVFRPALRSDLPKLVAMLADDPLGATREDASDPLPDAYGDALGAIATSLDNDIIVAEFDGTVAGFLQLTIIPSLTYRGRPRALIEGVRIRAELRGRGVGAALIEHATSLARDRGCHVVQLTTDKARPDAMRFYERLGFRASHEGMKRSLD